MLRVIKVYGSLAKFLGAKSFKAAVKSPLEAVRFLRANFPGLDAHMADQHYKISVGRHQLEAGAHPEQLTYPSGQAEPIRIIPVIAGAGRGVGQILAGVALVALAIVNPFGAATIGTFGGTPIAVASLMPAIGAIGASLILGGVSQLLTPTPQLGTLPDGLKNSTDPRSSYSFGGVTNVSRQGIPIPVVYGETVVGSVVVSAGINTEEI